MTVLRAVLVTPLSGPLARFGSSGASALRLWATHAPALAARWTSIDPDVMPWSNIGAAYTDDELRAMYAYFKSPT